MEHCAVQRDVDDLELCFTALQFATADQPDQVHQAEVSVAASGDLEDANDAEPRTLERQRPAVLLEGRWHRVEAATIFGALEANQNEIARKVGHPATSILAETPTVESPAGAWEPHRVAKVSLHAQALLFSVANLSSELGIARTVACAVMMVVHPLVERACRAAERDHLKGAHLDVGVEEANRTGAEHSSELGFDDSAIIVPGSRRTVHLHCSRLNGSFRGLTRLSTHFGMETKVPRGQMRAPQSIGRDPLLQDTP